MSRACGHRSCTTPKCFPTAEDPAIHLTGATFAPVRRSGSAVTWWSSSEHGGFVMVRKLLTSSLVLAALSWGGAGTAQAQANNDLNLGVTFTFSRPVALPRV